MRTVLILEEDDERRAEFARVAPDLGLQVRIWDDAQRMQAECEKFLGEAALISLEHDVDWRRPRAAGGTGLDVAKFLAEKRPVCPVIVHASNTDRSFSIYNELRFADWKVDRVGPVGDKWIDRHWKKKARELLAGGVRERAESPAAD